MLEALRSKTEPEKLLWWAVAALGFSAMLTQLTLIREFLTVFAGNEMVLGIILGSWLLLSGLGAFLGRLAPRVRQPIRALIAGHTLIALLPLVTIATLRTLRFHIFVRGAEIGVIATLSSCLVLLLPYCFLSGFLLTLFCAMLKGSDHRPSLGRVYLADSLGSILAGFLFSFLLVGHLDHFAILFVQSTINLAFAAIFAWRSGHLRVPVLLLVLALASLPFLRDWNRFGLSSQYPGQDIVFAGNSPYGRLIITELAGQYNFIENGVPLFSTHNLEQVEEEVHYAMVQRPQSRQVLLISGGIAGTAMEVLKYGVEKVDYVEIDPLLLEVGRHFVPSSLSDRRIRTINGDGRRFVKESRERYAVIISSVPEPTTCQANRFYTLEFFKEAKARLEENGVFSFSFGHYENYVSDELAVLLRVTHSTLSSVFRNVLMIPGGKITFLASDGPMTTDIANRLRALDIQTQLLTPGYLKEALNPDRLADLRRATLEEAPANQDFNPVLYYYHLRYWLSQFDTSVKLPAIIFLALLALYLWQIRPVSFAVFSAGFAASALEIVILLVFQILYGSVYRSIGVLVTMFMAGLALGAWITQHKSGKWGFNHLILLSFSIAVLSACLPLLFVGISGLDTHLLQFGSSGTMGVGAPFVGQSLIAALILVLAMLVGMQFPLAGMVAGGETTKTASRLYTADFVGSCVGAFAVSAFLVPLFGVAKVCLATASLNILSALVILLRRRPA